MLHEAAIREAYFPRTSSPRSDRVYSARSSSLALRLAFFIDLPLAFCRKTRTDEPDRIPPLGVGYNQQATSNRDAKGDVPVFAN